jgi:hypothetical protein
MHGMQADLQYVKQTNHWHNKTFYMACAQICCILQPDTNVPMNFKLYTVGRWLRDNGTSSTNDNKAMKGMI